jgi:hypothetical protein
VINIKINLPEVEWESIESIFLAQDRDKWQELGTRLRIMRVPYNVGSFLLQMMNSCETPLRHKLFLFIYSSPNVFQSVLGHSAIKLTGSTSDM